MNADQFKINTRYLLSSQDLLSAENHLRQNAERLEISDVDALIRAMKSLSTKNLMDETTRAKMCRLCTKYPPSDSIQIALEDISALFALWESRDNESMKIPADIFYAKTVPLPNIELTITYDDNNHECVMFSIFDGWQGVVDSFLSNDPSLKQKSAIIGMMRIKSTDQNAEIIIPIILNKDNKIILIRRYGWNILTSPNKFSAMEFTFSIACVERELYFYLKAWYSIQIAMLHPQIKEVIINDKTSESIAIPKPQSKKKKKRSIKYIKHRIVDNGSITSVVNSLKTKMTRHTLSWYVIGHWRHYKSGKNTFISGYWKGPLRDLKRNIDAGRNRIIDTHE